MKIVVCVKPVPADGMNLMLDVASFRLDRSGPVVINDVDLQAVERALELIEAVGGEGTVVAVAMTPAAAARALTLPLGMGVERAIAIADPEISGSDLLGTSRVLAHAIAAEDADLVLFGAAASDSKGAMLWAAIAERLKISWLSNVTDLQPGSQANRIVATRRYEAGYEKIEIVLPCALAVSGSGTPARQPSLKGMIEAKRKSIEIRALNDFGVKTWECGAAASGTTVTGIREAESRPRAEIIEGNNDAARRIYEFLRARRSL